MPNITIAARLTDDAEWTGIPVARVAGCDHCDTICSGCWESWDTDWTFLAQDVPAAIAQALQFAADVELVRSLAATTPLADLLAGMRNNGRTEQHIAEVLTEAANHAEDEFPTCGVCGTPNVEDAGEHADSTGHWPAATKPAERLSVWTLTRMDPVRTVQEGDYHEMYVVAKTAQAAREWAYLRAVGDNKPEPKVWLEGDEFALRVLYFYEVDDEATTGVMLAETWTVDKMGTVPFRRR